MALTIISMDDRSPLTSLRDAYAAGRRAPRDTAEQALALANRNASRNTYLWLEAARVQEQVEQLQTWVQIKSTLWGVPVSLKDCFDLQGAGTTCGSRLYASRPAADRDSAFAGRLRALGALIIGKTHLHPLAYGITGQNPEYGDCLQPRDATLLTGGSSSGAAASVQEGSAMVAVGTDTGGSIRVPAALCGLVGFRASRDGSAGAWPGKRDAWQGAAHLAPSFDTLGFLLRDLRDVGPVNRAFFDMPVRQAPPRLRIGVVDDGFLMDCESEVRTALEIWKQELAADGAFISEFETEIWSESLEIFAGIQAHEAAQLHAGVFGAFEPAIRERLEWGASLSPSTVNRLRRRREQFNAGMAQLFHRFDLLMLPAAPVSRLPAGDDLSSARGRILRYTTPLSLAGLPALSLPGELLGANFGTGVQIAAPSGADADLLAFADHVGAALAAKLR